MGQLRTAIATSAEDGQAVLDDSDIHPSALAILSRNLCKDPHLPSHQQCDSNSRTIRRRRTAWLHELPFGNLGGFEITDGTNRTMSTASPTSVAHSRKPSALRHATHPRWHCRNFVETMGRRNLCLSQRDVSFAEKLGLAGSAV